MTFVFFKSLVERALKTFCQTLAAVLTAGALDLFSVAWLPAISTAGMAALLSVLTSVGSAPWGDVKTPSLVSTEE